MDWQLTVSVALIERDAKFLIIRRFCPSKPYWHHRWEFPGGKIEVGETPEQALQREVFEETQLTVETMRLLGVHTHHWNLPSGVQQTFILLYLCSVNPGDVVLNPKENDAYDWNTIDAIIQKEDLLEANAKMIQDLYLTPRV